MMLNDEVILNEHDDGEEHIILHRSMRYYI